MPATNYREKRAVLRINTLHPTIEYYSKLHMKYENYFGLNLSIKNNQN